MMSKSYLDEGDVYVFPGEVVIEAGGIFGRCVVNGEVLRREHRDTLRGQLFMEHYYEANEELLRLRREGVVSSSLGDRQSMLLSLLLTSLIKCEGLHICLDMTDFMLVKELGEPDEIRARARGIFSKLKVDEMQASGGESKDDEEAGSKG